jgi:hypothetical protein
MTTRPLSSSTEEAASKRARGEVVSSSVVLAKCEGALRTFCHYGLLTPSECQSWIGQFFPEVSSSQVVSKCTNLVQTVFRRIQESLSSWPAEPLLNRAAYDVEDLDAVAQAATRLYAQGVTSELRACATAGTLAPNNTAFAFPLSVGLQNSSADPSKMLVRVADFAAARLALFNSPDIRDQLGMLVDRLWDRISNINTRNYRDLQRAFKIFSEHHLLLKLPSLNLEASAEAIFEEAKNHLRALISIDLTTHVIDANETPDFRTRPCSWIIRTKDQREPRYATELLLEWLPFWAGTGFFEESEAQKLLIAAFEKALQQDIQHTQNLQKITGIKFSWQRWEKWCQKNLQRDPPNKQAFLLIFDDESLPLNPVEAHHLSRVSPFIKTLMEGSFLEGSVKQAKIEGISLEEFNLFYRLGIDGTCSFSSLEIGEMVCTLFRVALRFQCLHVAGPSLKIFIPRSQGAVGMEELFRLERKMAWNQCLEPEVGRLWAPFRQKFIEKEVMPHLDFPGLIHWLRKNFQHAQSLEMPCFHLPMLYLREAYFTHPSYNADVLIEVLNLYKNTLQDLRIESLTGFSLLGRFDASHLNALTLNAGRANSWQACPSQLPSIVGSLTNLTQITLHNCNELEKWIKEIVKAPKLEQIMIYFYLVGDPTWITKPLNLIPLSKSVVVWLGAAHPPHVLPLNDEFCNRAFGFSSFSIKTKSLLGRGNFALQQEQRFTSLHHANGVLTIGGITPPSTLEKIQKLFPGKTVVQATL